MDKSCEIINKAKELFKIYGYAKTTMTDIANHLEISKALLYYYFKDKESIFVALAKQEQSQFINEITKLIAEASDAKQKILEYPYKRLELLKKMVTLIINQETYTSVKPFLIENALKFKAKEISLVKEIMQKGINEGAFINVDIEEYAVLYVSIFRGLIKENFSKSGEMDISSNENEQFKKQADLITNMFIKSISQ